MAADPSRTLLALICFTLSTPATSLHGAQATYNPGHYIATNAWEDQAAMVEAISKTGVKGVLNRYLWRDLEPEPGAYDFSAIESDLALVARHGKQLIIRIEDKSFKPRVKPTPPDLWEEYTIRHGNRLGGYIAKRWDPHVTERMSALTRALGQRFDGHPNLEGITFEESALSFTAEMQERHGYSPERYRDETIRMLRNTRTHFPGSRIFWSMNFFPGNQAYIGEIAEAVAPLDIAMGGPDILPDNDALVRLTYPFYKHFRHHMTLFGSVQYTSFRHEHADPASRTKYWTMEELFLYARDRLHVDYVFWTQKRRPEPPDSYDWTDALPVIQAHPRFNERPSAALRR